MKKSLQVLACMLVASINLANAHNQVAPAKLPADDPPAGNYAKTKHTRPPPEGRAAPGRAAVVAYVRQAVARGSGTSWGGFHLFTPRVIAVNTHYPTLHAVLCAALRWVGRHS